MVCADEKPSIQARARKHASQPAIPGGEGQLVEHEYERKGALCYLAAWDVRRAKLFDRGAPKGGIVPFDQLVEQFITQAPYSTAQRVFVIVDNGSAHRGQRSIDRLQGAWPNLILVHTPVHASWVNQAEIYFSVTQRKVLQPNNFSDLDTLERTLLAFGRHYEQIAQPFEWKFTRQDLHTLLERLEQPTHNFSSLHDLKIRQRTCEDHHLVLRSNPITAPLPSRRRIGGYVRRRRNAAGDVRTCAPAGSRTGFFYLPTLARVGSGMPRAFGRRVGRFGAVVVAVLCVSPVAAAEGASFTPAPAALAML